jgi:hypothetical protein
MASSASVAITKDDLKALPILSGSSNYPIWANRMQAFFTHKKLWDVVHRPPGNNPNARTRELLSDTAHILMQKIGNRIYNGIITPERMINGHEIWYGSPGMTPLYHPYFPIPETLLPNSQSPKLVLPNVKPVLT